MEELEQLAEVIEYNLTIWFPKKCAWLGLHRISTFSDVTRYGAACGSRATTEDSKFGGCSYLAWVAFRVLLA